MNIEGLAWALSWVIPAIAGNIVARVMGKRRGWDMEEWCPGPFTTGAGATLFVFPLIGAACGGFGQSWLTDNHFSMSIRILWGFCAVPFALAVPFTAWLAYRGLLAFTVSSADRVCQGLDAIDNFRAGPAPKGPCPACQQAMSARDVTACGKCSTPHHRQCWDTRGGCAIDGCRS